MGFRAASIWVYIEFIADSDPTLQILGEKKVIPYLKFNTPVGNHVAHPIKERSKMSLIIDGDIQPI